MSDFTDRLRATGGKGQGGPVKQQAADLIDEMEVVLRAFAEAASDLPDHISDMCPVVLTTDAEDNPVDQVLIGDFREARATLSKLEAMK